MRYGVMNLRTLHRKRENVAMHIPGALVPILQITLPLVAAIAVAAWLRNKRLDDLIERTADIQTRLSRIEQRISRAEQRRPPQLVVSGLRRSQLTDVQLAVAIALSLSCLSHRHSRRYRVLSVRPY